MTWLPLFLFAVLFGLSMDYHVFIVSRIKELADRGASTEQAVARGIAATAGTVTAAAAVMVAVFAIFATLSTLEIKQMGVGLAVAVLIDATVIRAVLLPATMKLLGRWNWYLPRWLRWLPRVRAERSPGRPLTEIGDGAPRPGTGRRATSGSAFQSPCSVRFRSGCKRREQVPGEHAVKVHALAAGGLNLFLVVIWAITSRGYFWPIWTMLALALPLGIHAWLVYAAPIGQAAWWRGHRLDVGFAIHAGVWIVLLAFLTGVWAAAGGGSSGRSGRCWSR